MSGQDGATRRLAEFVAGLSFDDIPGDVVAHARRCVLDTLGCGLHGSALPWTRLVQDVVRAEGATPAAALWGTPWRGSPAQAALVNGSAVHGFEMDDLHMDGLFHPGAVSLPPALALLQGRHATGRDLLVAVVAGYEVGARVGMALGQPHFLAGYHPQGTVGVFAAAAAAARALGLDADAVQHALGTAGSQAGGLMAAQEGAMVKRLHAGRAAQSGVYSALLAARGFTGIPDVLEAEFGGFCGTLGGDEVAWERLDAGLGQVWQTAAVGFKAYAACAAIHTSLDAAAGLIADEGLRADDVVRATAHTSTHTLLHCGFPYQPGGVTAAQMNVQYSVARMLLDGAASVEQYTDEKIRDPRAVDLAGRIEVVAEERLDALGPGRRHEMWLEVETTDGRLLSRHVVQRTGSREHPLSEDSVVEKFRTLAGTVLPAPRVEELVARVLDLDALRDVDELIGLLTPEGAGQ